jgi:secreted Zn-dependent insulinase-like peptidase
MDEFSPMGSIDPIHSNMNALYFQLVEDSLTEFVYSAQLEGLQYDLSALNYGIQVN